MVEKPIRTSPLKVVVSGQAGAIRHGITRALMEQ